MPPKLTEEQQKDVATRLKQFEERHAKNVEELQIDVAAYPMMIPAGNGTYVTIVRQDFADLKYRNPSPLSPLSDATA